MSDKLPPRQFDLCRNCGYDLSLHVAANLSDGAFVGQYLTICPTALFFSSVKRDSLPAKRGDTKPPPLY